MVEGDDYAGNRFGILRGDRSLHIQRTCLCVASVERFLEMAEGSPEPSELCRRHRKVAAMGGLTNLHGGGSRAMTLASTGDLPFYFSLGGAGQGKKFEAKQNLPLGVTGHVSGSLPPMVTSSNQSLLFLIRKRMSDAVYLLEKDLFKPVSSSRVSGMCGVSYTCVRKDCVSSYFGVS